jgi:hypothetical protein
MTNLLALKTVFFDTDNVVFTDDEYNSFLSMYGLTASEEASVDITDIMLTKAMMLESIASNPAMFKKYAQGSVSEDYEKRFLYEQAQAIRRKYEVAS